jgi:hypothetical protein
VTTFCVVEPPSITGPCGHVLGIPFRLAALYVKGEGIRCGNCTRPINAYAEVRRAVEEDEVGHLTFSLAGGRPFTTRVRASGNTTILVDFHQHGVPPDGEVLNVFWGVDNTRELPPAIVGPYLPYSRVPSLLPLYVPGDAEPKDLVFEGAWAPRASLHASVLQLLGAIEAYVDAGTFSDEYDRVILPANTAVEIAVATLVTSLLNRSSARPKDVERFVDGSHARLLNVVHDRFPFLPGDVLGDLRSLIHDRNTVAHQGRLPGGLSRGVAARYLTAAFFALAYADVARSPLGL